MEPLNKPKTDEVIERHQFYAEISVHVNHTYRDINGIGIKISKLSNNFESVRDEVNRAKTRNNTIVTIAIVMWTVLGGGISLYTQRGVSFIDAVVQRVDSIEKKMTTMEYDAIKYKDLPTDVAAVKRIINDHQRQIDELSASKK